MVANERLRVLLRLGALASMTAITILSLVPGQLRPHVMESGRLEHFAAYCVTGFLMSSGSRRLAGWRAPIFLSAASAFFEVAQLFIPGRSGGLGDFFASSLGALAGTALAVLCWTAVGLSSSFETTR
jgi:VanZ family protein